MSAACSAGSEASTSASSEPVCELCGSASRTPSVSESSLSTGPESRVIPTCAPLWASPKATDADRGGRGDLIQQVRGNSNPHFKQGCRCRCHTSMSSAAASPARTSASPAEEAGSLRDNARVFGGSSLGSLGNYDPATSSLRTSQLSLLEDSTSCLQTLPRAGSMRSGTIFQRQPLAPLTGGTASGLLHTPTAKANQLSPSMQGREPGSWWPTPHGMPQPAAKRKPGPSGNELGRAVNEAQRTWPTPKGSPSGPDFARVNREGSGGDDLATAVAREATGSLNPTWVEWLMGYPPGWTEAE
jgi:hypothetical protein